MIKHILIPTDGSALSEKAIEYAVGLAQTHRARVSVITVITPWPLSAYATGFAVPDDYVVEMEKRATESLARADAKLTSGDVPHNTIKVMHEQPYQAIIDAASNNGCDLILMASHGRRGLSAIVLGSETLKVLTHSKVPVLVYRS